jgi:hypothetical protein
MQGEKDYCVFYGLAFALVSMGHGDLAGLVAAAAKYSVGEAEGYGDEPVRFLRSLVKGQVKLPSKCEREADEGMKCLWLLGRELRKAWQLEKVAPDDVLNDESLHPTVCVLFNSHGSGHHCVTIVGKGANRRVYDSSEKWPIIYKNPRSLDGCCKVDAHDQACFDRVAACVRLVRKSLKRGREE